jgi:hypothetical protein
MTTGRCSFHRWVVAIRVLTPDLLNWRVTWCCQDCDASIDTTIAREAAGNQS